jgi:hypothetical protein
MNAALRTQNTNTNAELQITKVLSNVKGEGRVGRGIEPEFTNAHEISTQLSNPQPERTLLQRKHHMRGRSMQHVHIFLEFMLNTRYINFLKLF